MTDLTALQRNMSKLLPNIDLRFNEPMRLHTSFKIGGNAEIMAFPRTVTELSQILESAKLLEIVPRILGAGTNILAPDAGVDGLVICLKDCLDGISLEGTHHIRVMSGVTMTRAAVFAANMGLSGLEFAHGIPGTVGGGVYMNAGAYGGEIADVCESVEVMDESGRLLVIAKEDMDFRYRHSRLETDNLIVVSALFCLTPKDADEIKKTMKELMARRSASQPLDLPSAGSAFKRPKDGYAAALIESAGLKGYRVGDAAISQKHAGFAVNLGNAKASDVKKLLTDVSDIVYEKSGIRLEPEVRIW